MRIKINKKYYDFKIINDHSAYNWYARNYNNDVFLYYNRDQYNNYLIFSNNAEFYYPKLNVGYYAEVIKYFICG